MPAELHLPPCRNVIDKTKRHDKEGDVKKQMKQLTKLRGVGKVLATRLVESGLDSYEKVAAAGEEALTKIKGINPKSVAAIVRQSAELVADQQSKKGKKEEQLKEVAASLKDQVKGISTDVNDRFKEELSGKIGKKIEKELMKVMRSLEKAETKLRTRGKKAEKGLAQAEKKLAGLHEAGLKKVRKGLQGARQSLKKVTS